MQSIPTTHSDRRPIGARDFKPLHWVAKGLAKAGVTPNQVSLSSLAFSLAGAIGLVLFGRNPSFPLAFATSGLILLRGCCNLLDGLIAVEGGKGTRNGAFFNEAPDRLADILILAGAGLMWETGWRGLSAGLGLGLLAMATCYVRALGKTLTGIDDFSGPGAKPHRMMILAIGLPLVPFAPTVLAPLLLVTIAILALVTVLRRIRNLLTNLQS